MAQFIDYYKTLGVAKDADEKTIKKAFRKMARKYHPDVNEGDAAAEKKFKAINEANAVLSDPEKRKKYDKYGKDWEQAEAYEKAGYGGGSPFGGGQRYTYTGGGGGDFSDFFSQMFGGQAGGNPFGGGFQGGGRRTRFKGHDVEATLQVRLDDILASSKQVLTIGDKQLRVTIPAGVEDGQTLKLKGQGRPGMGGGPAGDLYVTFQVQVPAPYERRGADLIKPQTVSLTTLVLGGKAEVTTPTGTVAVPIPAGTPAGKRIRLKGKGLPVYKGGDRRGHLYLDLSPELPTELTAKQRELFEQLRDAGI